MQRDTDRTACDAWMSARLHLIDCWRHKGKQRHPHLHVERSWSQCTLLQLFGGLSDTIWNLAADI